MWLAIARSPTTPSSKMAQPCFTGLPGSSRVPWIHHSEQQYASLCPRWLTPHHRQHVTLLIRKGYYAHYQNDHQSVAKRTPSQAVSTGCIVFVIAVGQFEPDSAITRTPHIAVSARLSPSPPSHRDVKSHLRHQRPILLQECEVSWGMRF